MESASGFAKITHVQTNRSLHATYLSSLAADFDPQIQVGNPEVMPTVSWHVFLEAPSPMPLADTVNKNFPFKRSAAHFPADILDDSGVLRTDDCDFEIPT